MREIGTVACMVVILCGGALTARLDAQVHVDLGFHGGHHGYYHGGHYGWHDYGWYPRYVYRPYEYVYIAPPLIPQAAYVQPNNPTALQSKIDLSAVPASTTARPTARRNSLPAGNDQPVVIRNSSSSKANVFFIVNGATECELAPGQTMPLDETATCLVEFDRGGNFGTAAQELNSGSYEFVVTEGGWNLQRSTSDASRTTSRAVKKNLLPKERRSE